MSEATSLVVQNVQLPTRKSMIELAIEKGAGIETIERLVALEERMFSRDAEMAFNDAMNAAQAEMRPVAVDLDNPQTRSKYASYKALDAKIRPIYTKHGFSISYNTGDSDKDDCIRIFAYVSRAGYTRTYQVDMPNDGKGAKGGDVMTKTHATGAAMSYGMRYLLKMVFNIAIGESDTDGNEVRMDPEKLQEYLDAMQGANSRSQLKDIYTQAWKAACDAKDQSAQKQVVHYKNECLKKLPAEDAR